jgi:hypothetical protein
VSQFDLMVEGSSHDRTIALNKQKYVGRVRGKLGLTHTDRAVYQRIANGLSCSVLPCGSRLNGWAIAESDYDFFTDRPADLTLLVGWVAEPHDYLGVKQRDGDTHSFPPGFVSKWIETQDFDV